jgi:hypothetical protein
MFTLVTGRKVPRRTRTGLWCRTSLGCRTSPLAEHGRLGKAELHQLEAHEAVVHVAEFDARELDHVDLEALGGQVVEQRFDELLGLVVQKERTVQQVDTHDAQGFLLQAGFAIEHAHVQDDLAGSSSRGWAWNLSPIQPWHSAVLRKPLATTVSANTKNAVVSPRAAQALDVFSCS